MLKYCFSNGCPCDEEKSCKQAAAGGHLDCLRFLFDKVKPSRDTEEDAAHTGSRQWSHRHLEISSLKKERYLYAVKLDCVATAARYGKLDCLKYLVEEAKVPLNNCRYVAYARYYEHHECENYLLENGFSRTNGRRIREHLSRTTPSPAVRERPP